MLLSSPGSSSNSDDVVCCSQQGQKKKFHHLPFDVIIRVLKYLPLRERVRFERVSPEWKHNLDAVWKSQKKLAIYYCPKIERGFKCGHLEQQHQIPSSCIFVDEGSYFSHMKRDSYHVIRKCHNLKVLRYNASFIVSPSFGSDIATFCPDIEHVSFPDVNTFRAFCGYSAALQGKCNITCVHITEPDLRPTLEGFADDLLAFLNHCPRLQSFVNMSYSNTLDVVHESLSRIKHIQVQTFIISDQGLVEELKRAKQMESFSCNHGTLTQTTIDALVRLPNLKSIGLPAVADDDDFAYRSLASKGWNAFTMWAEDPTVPVEWGTIRRFLQTSLASLRHLSLMGVELTSGDIVNICNLVPHLESLDLGMYLPSPATPHLILTQPAINSLSIMINLGRLLLQKLMFTVGQFNQIIHSLGNLNELYLIDIDLTLDMRRALLGQCRRRRLLQPYDKSILYVFVNQKLLCQLTEDADEITDGVQVIENMRIVYTASHCCPFSSYSSIFSRYLIQEVTKIDGDRDKRKVYCSTNMY